MMNGACRNRLSIELRGPVAVVTKTRAVHHEAHVQQKLRCSERLLPPQSTEGQTAHRYTTPPRSLFPPLVSLHCIMFCPFLLLLPLFSPWLTTPRGKRVRGVDNESFLGVWKSVCVCCVHVCACVQAHTRAFHGWQYDSAVWAVKPEQWAEPERSSSSNSSSVIWGRDPPLCPHSLPPTPGEIQQLQQIHSTDPEHTHTHTMHRILVYDASPQSKEITRLYAVHSEQLCVCVSAVNRRVTPLLQLCDQ